MAYPRLAFLLLAAPLFLGCANVRRPASGGTAAPPPVTVSFAAPTAAPVSPFGPRPPSGTLLDIRSGARLSAVPSGIKIRTTDVGDSDEPRPTMNVDQDVGAATVAVTDRLGRFAVYAAGSRDDLRVVVHDQRTGRRVDVGGGLALCLCDAPSTPQAAPLWSPSDNFFSYISGIPAKPETLQIVVVDIRSMSVRTLPPGSSLPGGIAGMIWQPARDVLVYEREGEVFTYDAQTGASVKIGRGSFARFRTTEMVQYRGEGITPGHVETVLYNVATRTEVARVRHVGFPLDFALLTHSNGIAVAHQPVWSQDGAMLAVTRNEGSGTTSVILIDSTTGRERVLFQGLPTPDPCAAGWTYELRWSVGDGYVQVETTPINCGV